MNIKIHDRSIEIKINKNLKDLDDKEILELYKKIKIIRQYELNNGNEIDKAQIYLTYKKDMIIKEYINIFSLIRYGTLYEIYTYFKNFNEIKNTQNTSTNININEYITSNDDITQIIILNFLYKPKINKIIITKEKEKMDKILNQDTIDFNHLK